MQLDLQQSLIPSYALQTGTLSRPTAAVDPIFSKKIEKKDEWMDVQKVSGLKVNSFTSNQSKEKHPTPISFMASQ